MLLLITVSAAVISSLLWYLGDPRDPMKLSYLCSMYWGASLMWMVDAVFEYAELGTGYFTPSPDVMLNDAFLGMSVVLLGLLIWLVLVVVKDPKGRIRNGRRLEHDGRKESL